MGDFGSKYSKIRPTKDRRHDPMTRKEFNIQQDNNDIVNHAEDKILLQENNKVSAEEEAHENIESELDEDDLYNIDKMSLDEKNKRQNDVNMRLEEKLKIYMRLK